MTAKMMKSGLAVVLALTMFFGFSGAADAGLTTVGTASYLGSDYNLIHDSDQSIVWLDYVHNYVHTNPGSPEDRTWQATNEWANGLGSNLTVTLNPGYTTDIDWTAGWRLPAVDESVIPFNDEAGYEGPDVNGYYSYDYGSNMTNTEIGYLYYTILGNDGIIKPDGSPGTSWPDNEFEHMVNHGPFTSFDEDMYFWMSNELSGWPEYAWIFDARRGENSVEHKSFSASMQGIAIIDGDVSAVPVPAAVWLLGSGLVGLAGIRRKSSS